MAGVVRDRLAPRHSADQSFRGGRVVVDVFLSYSRVDKESAQKIVDALSEEGWDIWWDPEIVGGADMDDFVADRLDVAKCVVVLWSERSVKSRWVRGEARVGADRGVLVPVRIDKVQPPIDLRAIHAVDLSDGHQKIADVIRAVRLFVGSPEHSADHRRQAELRQQRKREILTARLWMQRGIGFFWGVFGAIAGFVVDYIQAGAYSSIFLLNKWAVRFARSFGDFDLPLYVVVLTLAITFGSIGAYVYPRTRNIFISAAFGFGMLAILMLFLPPSIAESRLEQRVKEGYTVNATAPAQKEAD